MWPRNPNNDAGVGRWPTEAVPPRYFSNPQPGSTGVRPISPSGEGFRGGFNRFNGGNNSSPSHRFKVKRFSPPPCRAFKSNSSERLGVTNYASNNDGIDQFHFKPGTWVETPTTEGGCYYYHAESRETTWNIPTGPGINIVLHKNFRGGRVSGNQPSVSAPAGSTRLSNDVNASQHAPIVCPNPPVFMPQSPQMKSPEFSSPIIRPGPVSTATPPLPTMMPPPFQPFSTPFMMNLPWNPASHLPMPEIRPFTFPPPSNPTIPFVPPPLVEPISTFSLQNTTDWTEHVSLEGIRYHYNSKTGVSSWENPESIILNKKQHEASNSTTTDVKIQRKTKTRKCSSSSTGKQTIDEATSTSDSTNTNGSRKPVLCKHVVGASWCIVYTNDKKMFYFNPAMKESVWERPAELFARNDVDEIIKAGYEELANKPEKTEIAEASSTTLSPPPSSSYQPSRLQEQMQKEMEKSLRVKEEELESIVDACETKTGITEAEAESSEIKVGTESAKMKDETESVELQNTEVVKSEIEIGGDKPENFDPELNPVSADTSVSENSTTPILSASEAVAIAMKERATIPYDVRVLKFREMLLEKKVSAFSPWEKELRKIVFDPRYLLLTCKERKAVFDLFVKERAEVELQENKEKLGDAKEKFIEFIKEVNSDKLTYSDFEKKFANDDRMKLIEKSKDRRDLFMDIVDENRRKQRKLEQLKSEQHNSLDKQTYHCVTKVKASFVEFLEKRAHDYDLSWVEFYENFKLGSDTRFQSLTGFEMGDLYRLHRSRLKDRKRRNTGEAEREHKKTKKKKSKHSRKHKKSSSKHEADSSGHRRTGEGKGAVHKRQKRDHSTSESDKSRHSDGEIVSTSESE